MIRKDSIENAKKAAGFSAADYVKSGMVIGIGTGSTATYFIEKLIQRCKEGLKIKAVTTSMRSFIQACKGNIPLIEINSVTALDLTIDGADEIDLKKRMIKGGGGALLREKIVALMSREMIAVVDEKKVVSKLGSFPLPIEILPFGYRATLRHIENLKYKPILRQSPDGSVYVTDNGNYICDLHFPSVLDKPEEVNNHLLQIPGVLETGFFFHLAKKVIVGYYDGRVEIQ